MKNEQNEMKTTQNNTYLEKYIYSINLYTLPVKILESLIFFYF